MNSGKPSDQFLGCTVSEVILGRISAQILQRKDSQRCDFERAARAGMVPCDEVGKRKQAQGPSRKIRRNARLRLGIRVWPLFSTTLEAAAGSCCSSGKWRLRLRRQASSSELKA